MANMTFRRETADYEERSGRKEYIETYMLELSGPYSFKLQTNSLSDELGNLSECRLGVELSTNCCLEHVEEEFEFTEKEMYVYLTCGRCCNRVGEFSVPRHVAPDVTHFRDGDTAHFESDRVSRSLQEYVRAKLCWNGILNEQFTVAHLTDSVSTLRDFVLSVTELLDHSDPYAALISGNARAQHLVDSWVPTVSGVLDVLLESGGSTNWHRSLARYSQNLV